MRYRVAPIGVAVAALVLGAACDGVLDIELDDAVGTYVLKSVAGKKLRDDRGRDRDRDRDGDPDRRGRRFRGRLLERTAEFEVRVVHEAIRLRPDGTGTITSVLELFRIEDGEFEEERTITRDVRFVLDDGRIEIAEDCPPDLDCVLPRSLIMRRQPSWFRDELYQAFSPFGGPALLYERVTPAF